MTDEFDGAVEKGSAPHIFSGTEIHDQVKDLRVMLGKWKFKRRGIAKKKKPVEKIIWKKRSIF